MGTLVRQPLHLSTKITEDYITLIYNLLGISIKKHVQLYHLSWPENVNYDYNIIFKTICYIIPIKMFEKCQYNRF